MSNFGQCRHCKRTFNQDVRSKPPMWLELHVRDCQNPSLSEWTPTSFPCPTRPNASTNIPSVLSSSYNVPSIWTQVSISIWVRSTGDASHAFTFTPPVQLGFPTRRWTSIRWPVALTTLWVSRWFIRVSSKPLQFPTYKSVPFLSPNVSQKSSQ